MTYKKQKSYLKWIIGFGVIALTILSVTMLNFGDSMVYFYTPKEVVTKKNEMLNKPLMIGAMVKQGTVSWVPEDLQLDFTLTDFKGHEIPVKHKGVKPDMFKENTGVVVEGRFNPDGTIFSAKKLIVKHSEEYKIPEKGNSIDKELLEKSIFKNQGN